MNGASDSLRFLVLPLLANGIRKHASAIGMTVEGPYHPLASEGEAPKARVTCSATLRVGGDVATGRCEFLITDRRLIGVMSGVERVSGLVAFTVPSSGISQIPSAANAEIAGAGWSLAIVGGQVLDELYRPIGPLRAKALGALFGQELRSAPIGAPSIRRAEGNRPRLSTGGGLAAAPPRRSHTRRHSRTLLVAAAVVAVVTGGLVALRPSFRSAPQTASRDRESAPLIPIADVEMPSYEGAPRDLASWLDGAGQVVVGYAAASAGVLRVPSGGSSDVARACEEARAELEVAGPKPPEVLEAAGESPDSVVRELTANDLAAKSDLLRSCLSGPLAQDAVDEVARTHALLESRLAYLREKRG